MARFVIATIKSWNIRRAEVLQNRFPKHEFYIVKDKEKLNSEMLDQLQPKYVFFPHWSWIIPKDIFQVHTCIVFHMTDLPFGRGGSPLQNLLERGIYRTKISAIKVDEGLDTGDVYLKEPLDISEGSAEQIFNRASEIIFEKMIPRIITENIMPTPQKGETVSFVRRTPEQSEIPHGLSTRQIYDYIRMLDGEGYPMAYIKTDQGVIKFKNAVLKDGELTAKAIFGGAK